MQDLETNTPSQAVNQTIDLEKGERSSGTYSMETVNGNSSDIEDGQPSTDNSNTKNATAGALEENNSLPVLPDRTLFKVDFEGSSDPLHPHNWPITKKIVFCAVVGLCAFSVSMGSAMFSAASPVVEATYHVGSTVGALGTSLFVFGFASGPVVWGPASEMFGRKPILVASSFGYICFCFATGTSKDIQAIMICRFFQGFIGAAPLVVAPASMADLFNMRVRGLATTIFIIVLFGGPMFAPIISAFIVKNQNMGWRWTQYISGILSALAFIFTVFIFEETYAPVILVKKAKSLREETGNWGHYAPKEETSLNLQLMVKNNLARPLTMLIREPILFLITLYNAFIYGIMYLFLTAIPFIFAENYHMVSGVAELPYLSMFIGILIGAVISIFFEKRFDKIVALNEGKSIPEERLPPMMIGSFFFAGGMFWMGWSGDFPDKVHWIVPTIAAAAIGIGLITIFLPSFNYIIDCYLTYAASALAGNAFLRSAFGGAFPLFARQMFVNLGVRWAATLLGGIAVLLIPVPFIFYKYGKFIRQKSSYAFVLQ